MRFFRRRAAASDNTSGSAQIAQLLELAHGLRASLQAIAQWIPRDLDHDLTGRLVEAANTAAGAHDALLDALVLHPCGTTSLGSSEPTPQRIRLWARLAICHYYYRLPGLQDAEASAWELVTAGPTDRLTAVKERQLATTVRDTERACGLSTYSRAAARHLARAGRSNHDQVRWGLALQVRFQDLTHRPRPTSQVSGWSERRRVVDQWELRWRMECEALEVMTKHQLAPALARPRRAALVLAPWLRDTATALIDRPLPPDQLADLVNEWRRRRYGLVDEQSWADVDIAEANK